MQVFPLQSARVSPRTIAAAVAPGREGPFGWWHRTHRSSLLCVPELSGHQWAPLEMHTQTAPHREQPRHPGSLLAMQNILFLCSWELSTPPGEPLSSAWIHDCSCPQSTVGVHGSYKHGPFDQNHSWSQGPWDKQSEQFRPRPRDRS